VPDPWVDALTKRCDNFVALASFPKKNGATGRSLIEPKSTRDRPDVLRRYEAMMIT